MPSAAVVLVLLSCVLHAFWNLLLKRAHDKLAFTALFLLLTPILYLPLFLWLAPVAVVPPAGWACMLATSVVYFGYFVGLALAYQDGELSVAYPLTRSLGPALVLAWGILFLGERPTPLGLAGVLLVILGATAIVWPRKGSVRDAWRGLRTPSSLAAVWVALMYSFYSLIDKVAVGRLQISPPLYIYLTYALSAALVAPWVARRQGMAALRAEWRINARACVIVAVLNLFTYLLVLYALSLPGTPVGYVIPLRSVSVLFGVLFGVQALGEGGRRPKLAAASVMVAGVALMAWKG